MIFSQINKRDIRFRNILIKLYNYAIVAYVYYAKIIENLRIIDGVVEIRQLSLSLSLEVKLLVNRY